MGIVDGHINYKRSLAAKSWIEPWSTRFIRQDMVQKIPRKPSNTILWWRRGSLHFKRSDEAPNDKKEWKVVVILVCSI